MKLNSLNKKKSITVYLNGENKCSAFQFDDKITFDFALHLAGIPDLNENLGYSWFNIIGCCSSCEKIYSWCESTVFTDKDILNIEIKKVDKSFYCKKPSEINLPGDISEKFNNIPYPQETNHCNPFFIFRYVLKNIFRSFSRLTIPNTHPNKMAIEVSMGGRIKYILGDKDKVDLRVTFYDNDNPFLHIWSKSIKTYFGGMPPPLTLMEHDNISIRLIKSDVLIV